MSMHRKSLLITGGSTRQTRSLLIQKANEFKGRYLGGKG